jgi:hypothetical protein
MTEKQVVGQFVTLWKTGPNLGGHFGLGNKVGGRLKQDPTGQCHSKYQPIVELLPASRTLLVWSQRLQSSV